MSMNDIIIGMVDKGSFRFPIEFDMFGIHQYIDNVTFDKGCSHSLISAKSLNLGDKSIETLKICGKLGLQEAGSAAVCRSAVPKQSLKLGFLDWKWEEQMI